MKQPTDMPKTLLAHYWLSMDEAMSRAFCHVCRRIPGWMTRDSETARLAALTNLWLVLKRIQNPLFAGVGMLMMREAP
jgi:hypothetical protein